MIKLKIKQLKIKINLIFILFFYYNNIMPLLNLLVCYNKTIERFKKVVELTSLTVNLLSKKALIVYCL
jgi:hypothetical protein